MNQVTKKWDLAHCPLLLWNGRCSGRLVPRKGIYPIECIKLKPSRKIVLFVDLIHFGYERLILYKGTMHVTTGKCSTINHHRHVTRIVEKTMDVVVEHYTHVFNVIITTSVLHDAWLQADVTGHIQVINFSNPSPKTLRFSLGLGVLVGKCIKSI